MCADKELCLASDFEGTLNINSQGKGLCAAFDKEDLLAGESWEDYDNILIQAGTVNVDAGDDAVHSNRAITITGGSLNLTSEDDAVHADEKITIGSEGGGSDPVINVPKCFEGIESQVLDIYSGNIDIVASDDGLNAVNPEDTAQTDLLPQPFEESGDESCSISVYGGDIYVEAGKDAFDSNGYITISGGNCVLFASTGKATRTSDALDAGCAITFSKNGGTLFGASPTGRMQTVPRCDGQNYEMGSLACEQGDVISVDDNGSSKEYTMACSDGFIIYTSPTYAGGSISDTTLGTTLTPKRSTKHLLKKVEAVAPTCTKKGSAEHWVCSFCGSLFADAEGAKELSKDSIEIARLGHSYRASKTVKATSSKNGYTIYKCSRCAHSRKECFSKFYVKGFTLKASKKAFVACWLWPGKTRLANFDKYQIRYSLHKDMKNSRVRTLAKNRVYTKFRKLKSNKKYYVQIRTFSKGCWSKWKTKTVQVK